MITLESIPEDTANAILDGIFALISPVTTLTEGLCVAITICIPAALASCARRHIASSTSPGATIIRSASSSMIITICGSFSIGGSMPSLFFLTTTSLYPFILRTCIAANFLYLSVISLTAQLSAPAAFLGSVTTGNSKCGIPLYTLNSTTFGSTIISLTSSGFAL